MKRFLEEVFLFSVVAVSLGIGSQSYATEEKTTDSTNTSSTQQVLESSTVISDSSNTLASASVSGETTASTNVLKDTSSVGPIQELPTTLWDIEDENEVKYDSDTPELPELTEQEVARIKELYEKAISEEKVNREMYLYKAFQENYQLNQKTYSDMKELFGDYPSYDDWFGEVMNYSAFPDGEGHSPNEKRRVSRATKRQNADRFKRDIRKGDIIIVESGGFGHAAIATSDNYVLEMTGGAPGPNYTNWIWDGIKNNNHQFNKENWLMGKSEQGFKKDRPMIDSYIQIWRVPNKNMANQCATYADKMFWNSKGGYKKNRYIDYRVTSATLTMNPNYCSKMVFQAYWYGSGSAPVFWDMAKEATFVSPAGIRAFFTDSYKPYKVDTY